MNLLKNSIVLILVIMFIFSCKKEREPVYEVPQELEQYIIKFAEEGNKRGMNLVIDDLIVEYGFNLEADGTEAAGLCHYETDDMAPRIELDTTSLNWTAHEYSREMLVFHELGHCILNRPHLETRFINDNYKSMMKGNGDPIFAGFNLFKRDYYIDELFDANTPPPAWASGINYADVSVLNKTSVYIEDYSNNSNGWTVLNENAYTTAKIENGRYILEAKTDTFKFVSQNINIDTSKDFEIETSVKVTKGEDFATCFIWGSRINNGQAFYYYGFNKSNDVVIFNTENGDYVSNNTADIQSSEFNKLTIRKQGDKMYFFINEDYHDIIDFPTFHGNQFGFLIPSNSSCEVEYLHVYELN